MPIVSTDIKFYRSAINNDLVTNGGRISTSRVLDNVLNNLFPNVSSTEREAGLTRYRKMFIRNENANALTFENVRAFIRVPSLADDYFRLIAGTDIDTQNDLSGYTDWCGTGILHASLLGGETEIEVDYDAANGVFDGATLVLQDDYSREFVTVDGTPSWLGTKATITLATPVSNAFDALDTIVGTVIDFGDIEPSVTNWVETGSGTYDETNFPLTLYNIGTIYDDWTLTFTSSTAFSVTGAVTGSIGAGSTLSDFKPTNGSSWYFLLSSSGWGGSWSIGDTITFRTVHAGKALWLKEVVPAEIAAYSNNVVTLHILGESA